MDATRYVCATALLVLSTDKDKAANRLNLASSKFPSQDLGKRLTNKVWLDRASEIQTLPINVLNGTETVK